MILNRIAVPALALLLGTMGLSTARASGAPQGPPPQGYGQNHGGWDAPPQDWQDVQQRGFRDGIDGARKDMDNHRRPNVNNRDEYRRPSVPRNQRQAYREGFRRGYEQGMAHLREGLDHPMGGPGQQMREPDRGPGMGPGMGMGPGPGSEIQRRGFQDGMDGARKDMDNHRRPDVNNRDEYRSPNVPRELQDAYREAFRRGYQQAMSQMMGGQEHH